VQPDLTWLGFIMLGMVAARSLVFYRGQPALPAVLLLLAAYGLLYGLALALPALFSRYRWLYFPLQMAVLLALAGRQPFLDATQVLYIPLSLQARRAFAFRPAVLWIALFALALAATLIRGLGWLEGAALSLLILATSVFLLSYDRLRLRAQRERDESQRLLVELQQAHQKLQEHAERAEALAAARERNRLALELHDSVSQSIFAVTLTSQATRILLRRDPARVGEQLEQLQAMTATALGQLRSLIGQLRPPPSD
jgi:signal transduction histidine kinase